MKYYITAHALTQGIIEVDAELTEDGKHIDVSYLPKKPELWQDAFASLEHARQDTKMRARQEEQKLVRKLNRVRDIINGKIPIKRLGDGEKR